MSQKLPTCLLSLLVLLIVTATGRFAPADGRKPSRSQVARESLPPQTDPDTERSARSGWQTRINGWRTPGPAQQPEGESGRSGDS